MKVLLKNRAGGAQAIPYSRRVWEKLNPKDCDVDSLTHVDSLTLMQTLVTVLNLEPMTYKLQENNFTVKVFSDFM